MTNDELQSYIDKYKKLLLESVEWWQKYTPDTKHGGFYNYLGRDGKVCGMVEISMVIPQEMPHYVRE